MCSNDGEMKARGIVCDSFECVPLIYKRRDNTRRATRWENSTCLFDSGGNQLFFHIISISGQFSDMKMTVSKLKFMVHWLVNRENDTHPATHRPTPSRHWHTAPWWSAMTNLVVCPLLRTYLRTSKISSSSSPPLCPSCLVSAAIVAIWRAVR